MSQFMSFCYQNPLLAGFVALFQSAKYDTVINHKNSDKPRDVYPRRTSLGAGDRQPPRPGSFFLFIMLQVNCHE